jgi:hypothetical protein
MVSDHEIEVVADVTWPEPVPVASQVGLAVPDRAADILPSDAARGPFWPALMRAAGCPSSPDMVPFGSIAPVKAAFVGFSAAASVAANVCPPVRDTASCFCVAAMVPVGTPLNAVAGFVSVEVIVPVAATGATPVTVDDQPNVVDATPTVAVRTHQPGCGTMETPG